MALSSERPEAAKGREAAKHGGQGRCTGALGSTLPNRMKRFSIALFERNTSQFTFQNVKPLSIPLAPSRNAASTIESELR